MRPSRTAAAIEAKLSSASTNSAASLAASLPFRPMAIPASARLSAGASFTPSPVIATVRPRDCSAVTRRSLWAGEVRAKTSVFDGRFGQCGVVHRLEIGAGQHALGVLQPDHAGDGARGRGMIAGDHLHPDAGGMAFGDRVDRLGPRRVDQADQPDQGEPALQIGGVQDRVVLRHRARCDGDHALAVGGELLDHPRASAPASSGSVPPSARALVGAERQHRLGRALDVDAGVALVVVVQHRHVAMRGIEGDRVGPGPLAEGLGPSPVILPASAISAPSIGSPSTRQPSSCACSTASLQSAAARANSISTACSSGSASASRQRTAPSGA